MVSIPLVLGTFISMGLWFFSESWQRRTAGFILYVAFLYTLIVVVESSGV